MHESAQLIQTLKALFSSQRLAILATEGKGQPYGNLIAFVVTDDLKHLLFATTRATRKYANISENPRVAMVMDGKSERKLFSRICLGKSGKNGITKNLPNALGLIRQPLHHLVHFKDLLSAFSRIFTVIIIQAQKFCQDFFDFFHLAYSFILAEFEALIHFCILT
jgi:hypothetical protein